MTALPIRPSLEATFAVLEVLQRVERRSDGSRTRCRSFVRLLDHFSVVLSIGYGSRISAVPGVLIEYFGLQNVGTLLCVSFTAWGLSALLGPLLAGLAVDLTASYSRSTIFAFATGSSALSQSLRLVVTVSPSTARPPTRCKLCRALFKIARVRPARVAVWL